MEDEYPLLLDTFLDDSQKRLRQLQKAKTVQELGEAAHTLKGSSSNMGAVKLADLCRQMEVCITQQPLRGVEYLLNRIDQEVALVLKLCREERRRFPSSPVR
ncbi:Hpt domain-containing protein [Pseudomonas sp. LS1212]|uniref:Hpt domain-containing protein n=1 Tax=Pseudomonas sp. LS1212 TaxID=2972478 RepID=UPI00215C6268|nr:Hpt domain-containing protein [Pseudomonas sp. LS1212]UVJ46488.1 Hpt domain-containing protein [Pseudomonas sp. LS1212]